MQCLKINLPSQKHCLKNEIVYLTKTNTTYVMYIVFKYVCTNLDITCRNKFVNFKCVSKLCTK